MRAVDVEGGLHAAARVIDAGAEPAIARGLHGMIELLGAETSTDPHETALSLLDHLSPRDDRPLPVHWYAMMSTFAVHAFDRLGEQTLRDRFIATLEGALGEAGEVHLARAIAAVHDHRPAAAKAALGPLLEGAAPCLFSASMIDAWLVAAEIDVHHGNPDRAQHALATALALAEPEEHVRRVAAAGPIVSRLLAARATAGSRTRFADTVRDRLATAGVLVEEPLTQRERIVLAALSRNATLREIATQEYISPNTVKTHVRNIYRKLGVSDREGVTAAAHALGIR
jgi:LuxR family maltose regulon positive regulatory protein